MMIESETDMWKRCKNPECKRLFDGTSKQKYCSYLCYRRHVDMQMEERRRQKEQSEAVKEEVQEILKS